jgi:hypothetical protein
MFTPVYLDLAAMVSPVLSLWLLVGRKTSFVGMAQRNIIRLNVYFFLILAADIIRVLTESTLAIYVMFIGFALTLFSYGHAAGVVQFCPEARSWLESMKILLKKSLLFPLFLLAVVTWLAVTLVFQPVTSSLIRYGNEVSVLPSFPAWYLQFTVVLAIPIFLYPSLLLLSSLRRTHASYTRNSLLLMLSSWLFFLTLGLFMFFLVSPMVPFSYEFGLIFSSFLYSLLAVSTRNLPGTTRFLKGSFLPQSFIKIGKRYLVLHDAGTRTISFLSSAFRNTIDAGARVVINTPALWLVDGLSRNDSRFSEWEENGKFVTSSPGQDDTSLGKERLSGKFGLSETAVVFVKELERKDLQRSISSIAKETKVSDKPEAEVFLLESSQAPRPQVAEFLQKNGDVELINLSEASEPFSTLVNLNHQRIEGSKILLEYAPNSNFEDLVNKFFDEGIDNAEMCALFTSKSSKLYRALKGKRMVRIIAASSLVSTPDELPDGEIQIPDKELGLVTSLVTDFLENNKSVAMSFVFDSVSELIRGERWEQVYSGIKQLIELLSPSTVTAIFLVNTETTEPRFLGAMRGLFSAQMRLDNTGNQPLRVAKAEF